MTDFSFRKNDETGKWVILAPRRSHRPNTEGKSAKVCPFCIGNEESAGEELYRFPISVGKDAKEVMNWHIRVIENKFPFTNSHEVVIHSPDHHKNFDELPFSQVELIFETYRQRYQHLSSKGQVYIFHNRGMAAGESIPHPHSQIAVLPTEIQLAIPPMDMFGAGENESFLATLKFWGTKKSSIEQTEVLETEDFRIFCPETSEWPDEVWIAPKRIGTTFGEITDSEITDVSFALTRILQLLDLRHGYEFPFNFYIYPGDEWYLRIMPRIKTLGGFEVGTQVMINTGDPKKTFAFLKEHFWEPNREKIKKDQRADYLRGV